MVGAWVYAYRVAPWWRASRRSCRSRRGGWRGAAAARWRESLARVAGSGGTRVPAAVPVGGSVGVHLKESPVRASSVSGWVSSQPPAPGLGSVTVCCAPAAPRARADFNFYWIVIHVDVRLYDYVLYTTASYYAHLVCSNTFTYLAALVYNHNSTQPRPSALRGSGLSWHAPSARSGGRPAKEATARCTV